MITIILFFVFFGTQTFAGSLNLSAYSQNLYLGKANNLISQNSVRGEWSWDNPLFGQTYFGVYLDTDLKSDAYITYTDKQVSPFIGQQSALIFGLPLRFFTELRSVNRIGTFFDGRKQHTYEWRTGLLAYDFVDFSSQFIEYYGALFYSTLYHHEVILQAWLKHGYRFSLSPENFKLDILHELNFDLNRFVQPNNTYVDYKPGLRIGFFGPSYQISVLQQYAISLAKRDGNRTPEWRTLLVYSQYF